MMVFGVILLLIGFIASIPIIWTIGIVLLVVGAILALIGHSRPASYTGRRYYY